MCDGNHAIDLVQACELWQEAGSQHDWKMIENNIEAFLTAMGSKLHHWYWFVRYFPKDMLNSVRLLH